MFFAIPTNTDAPIYHWPWVTVSLIALNVVAFGLTGGGYVPEAIDPWILQFGNGLHPVEWFSSCFVHFGLMHLVGNMIFLWGFGIVVEGKIGWWRYLLVYLGIALFDGLIMQWAMLGYDGPVPGIGGASGVIFALMAMSLVWAPLNEMTIAIVFFFFFIFRATTIEATILAFSLFYIGMNVLFACFGGFGISSEMAHLLGAAIGFGVAIAMVQLNWVDCENWDLLAVLRKAHRQPAGVQPSAQSNPTPARTPPTTDTGTLTSWAWKRNQADEDDPVLREADKRQASLRRIRRLLSEGKGNAALAEYSKTKQIVGIWELDEADLFKLANGLCRAKSLREAVPFMEEYIARFPGDADRVRIQLASILVQDRRRPRHALRILQPIDQQRLPAALLEHRAKIERRAKRMIDEGLLELDGMV